AMVRKRADTARVAYEIAKLPTSDLRQQLIDKVLEHGVNTRDIIYLVNQLLEEVQQRDTAQPTITEQIAPHVEEDSSPRPQREFVASSPATHDTIATASPVVQSQVSVATSEPIVSHTVLKTPTASIAKEQLSEHPGTSSTKSSVVTPAPVTSQTVPA